MNKDGAQKLSAYHLTNNGDHEVIRATLSNGHKTQAELTINGQGDGALSAFCQALENTFNFSLDIIHYDQHAIGTGTDASAVAYVQLKIDGERYCGIAKNKDIISASLDAILACVNQVREEVGRENITSVSA